MNTSQQIMLITTRSSDFSDFVARIQSSGKTVVQVATAQEAIDAVAKTAPAMAIIDDMVEAVSGMEITRRLLQINAFINTALVSDMDDDMFHEKSEGLGVLTKLPKTPGAVDAEALLGLLEQLNITLT